MVFLRLVRGFDVLEALKKLDFILLRPWKIPVKNLFFSAFVYFKKGLMALKIANIYFLAKNRRLKAALTSAIIVFLMVCS